jgi:hypothetical protein
MVMDKKILLLDKQPLVYQFLDQPLLNVFVVEIVVEHIEEQQSVVLHVAKKEIRVY